jgi:hypothetical protein
MKYSLEMIDYRYQTEYPFDYHAVVALTVTTKMPLGHFFASFTKTIVAENLSLLNPTETDIPQFLVVFVGRFPTPINDLTARSYQPAQFDTDYPPTITLAFLTDLSLAATFSNGMNEFDAVAVNDAFGLWRNQHCLSQNLVLFKHPEQTTQAGQVWKEMHIVTFEPTVESAVMDPFEAKEDANGDDFAGVKMSILSFLDATKFVVYHAKEPSDYFFGSHKVMFLLALFLDFAKGWHNLIHFVKSGAISN